MKQILVTILICITMNNTFAKGSSYTHEYQQVQFVKPCYITISSRTIVNGYTVYAFENQKDDVVQVRYGVTYEFVNVGEGKQQEYTNRMIKLIQDTCK